jgi:hypothetical protein
MNTECRSMQDLREQENIAGLRAEPDQEEAQHGNHQHSHADTSEDGRLIIPLPSKYRLAYGDNTPM